MARAWSRVPAAVYAQIEGAESAWPFQGEICPVSIDAANASDYQLALCFYA